MKIVSAAEMRAIDRATSERFGVSSLTLMENAGTAVAECVWSEYPDAKRIVVVCGKGTTGAMDSWRRDGARGGKGCASGVVGESR